jgi:error-prone DNA polymerase
LVHLHVRSWFSFLAGASAPEDLVRAAADLGQSALALTDLHGLFGAVRLARACRPAGIRPLFGATVMVEGFPLVLLARHALGYGNLCQALTCAHQAERLGPHLSREDLAAWSSGLLALTGGPEGRLDTLVRQGETAQARRWLACLGEIFPDALYVELAHRMLPGDGAALARVRDLACQVRLPVVASNAVRYARAEGLALYDALTCVRLGITVGDPHPQRPANDQAFLCDEAELRRRIPFPEALERTEEVAARCRVELLAGEVIPPTAQLPEGFSAKEHLRNLCEHGLPRLYTPDARPAARRQLEHELEVVGDLDLEEFFLVVHEVVEFARSRGIRCAGRGSAANSILSWLLGITAVDPLAQNLLFERFLHRGRKGMPDIDVDFDSARRPEVIAWMEERFGRQHTAMTATVCTYGLKSGVRDMLKVLGCTPEAVDRVAARIRHWDTLDSLRDRRGELQEALLGAGQPLLPERGGAEGRRRPGPTHPPPTNRRAGLFDVLFALLERLPGCPRHLGLHSGGMVLSRRPLTCFSPLQTSACGVRQLQFDKDDVEAMGLVKFDVLGLRMLSVLSEAVDLVREDSGRELDLEALPLDDEPTFELIRSGRSMGLFQIESPGQVHLLSRTRPQVFRDLVIQVALFRPGPLQGGMVNHYIERRSGRQPVEVLHTSLEPVLRDTLGIVLFQEQVLEICHRFAGMSLEEADEFRRLMSRWRDPGSMRQMQEAFVAGAMATHAVPQELALAVFRQVESFVGYGFCRSHAAAFARTVYHSAWLKAHHPAAYMAAVLQHHPGFHPLATLIEEVRHLGVRILPADAWLSGWRYTLEAGAIRVPLCAVTGVSPSAARHLVENREGCSSLEALLDRVELPVEVWEALARAGAFRARCSRREALWRIGLRRPKADSASRSSRRLRASASVVGPRRPARDGRPASGRLAGRPEPDLGLEFAPSASRLPRLEPLDSTREMAWDFRLQGFSPQGHPLSAHRERLHLAGVTPVADVFAMPAGQEVRIAGLVMLRQKPPTARGMVFLLLEDESARIQAAVTPPVFRRLEPVLHRGALWLRGRLEAGGAGRGDDEGSFRSLLVQQAGPLEELLEGPIMAERLRG